MIERWVLEAGRRLGWLSLGVQQRRSSHAALSAALVLAVPLLVLAVDVQLALLAFLSVPLLALANAGWRRLAWCSAAIAACAASTVVASVPLATTAVRMPLVVVEVCVVLALAHAFQREAREAELRRELTAEAHHRIKNSLQGVADLLYLARAEAEGDGGLERAADRIRSIAAVHELLGRDGGESVSVDDLLRRVAAGLDGGIEVQAEPLALPVERAQRVGIVANELLTNAAKHGRAPIRLTLDGDEALRLTVEDAGRNGGSAPLGTGLTLLRHVVEYGLDGTLELVDGDGGTRALVAFPRTPCAS